MNERPVVYVVTCEHGGNDVPPEFADLFDSAHARRCLHSHRGHDPGALFAAERFAAYLAVPLIASKTTRLLVDLNRSEHSPSFLSEFTRGLESARAHEMVNNYYRPYRDRVMDRIGRLIRAGDRVIHLSIHTFAARFRGQTRPIDLGVLFDPGRELETRFCATWISSLRDKNPRRRVLANEPYSGSDDGLTTTCRDHFAGDRYLGIEIEISQRYARRTKHGLSHVVEDLIQTMPQCAM